MGFSTRENLLFVTSIKQYGKENIEQISKLINGHPWNKEQKSDKVYLHFISRI